VDEEDAAIGEKVEGDGSRRQGTEEGLELEAGGNFRSPAVRPQSAEHAENQQSAAHAATVTFPLQSPRAAPRWARRFGAPPQQRPEIFNSTEAS
jgi:hypothetical protein